MSAPCAECGGRLIIRPSGFASCEDCGRLVVRPPAVPQAEEAGVPESDPGVMVPDFAEPMVGWRAWGVAGNLRPGELPLLHSATYGAVWTPREPMVAVCKSNPDHVPGERCACGLYSAKTREHLQSMNYHRYGERRSRHEFCVMGEVNLWGKIVEGTQGWRAQCGYPKKLYLPFEAYKLRVPLMETYGCEVVLNNILKKERTK